MKHDHDHFTTCEFAIERTEIRMQAIIEKLNVLLTPNVICEGIYRAVTNYHNNNKMKEEKRNNNTQIDAQNVIGWQRFCRERVFIK